MADGDIEIARRYKLRPIDTVAGKLGLESQHLMHYGPYKAKVPLDVIGQLPERPGAKLVLVTAMTPTPAGEGKSTTTVGLGVALNHIGKKAVICLREPSLGPCFGIKGGATGGGQSQVVPMEDINLHFTGDFHAITTANNLLAALIDNHVYWGNELDIDVRRINWRRVLDMNDRALRSVVSSLGGAGNGFPREDGFDITVASEVMAIFCLARNLDDLQQRLGNIIFARARGREHRPLRASQLKGQGAMTALLKDALMPNLVQTMEGNPAFVHGGPFANIAHGCNSVMATTTALKLGDYVVTEAGFGADLGAEKFFDIKCRKAGLSPAAAVIVATVRALKMHGGVALGDLARENVKALEDGFANLARHVSNVAKFGVPAVVGINRFHTDTDAEHDLIRQKCAEHGIEAVVCSHWAEGGRGAADLAHAVVKLAEGNGKPRLKLLYPDELPLWDKVRTVAQTIYGAQGIIADQKVRDQFREYQDAGFGHYPVCIAKTQYSFSTDPALKGAPSNHVVPVREIRIAGGAEFLVVICGDIMTMPGLPRVPSAQNIGLNSLHQVEGLC
jgi:formate--tetrahydrofolate ligase